MLHFGFFVMQVMQHMSKCFQAIDRLKLDQEQAVPGGPRPNGLGMVSCVGEEYVPFKSALPLQGKVSGAGSSEVICRKLLMSSFYSLRGAELATAYLAVVVYAHHSTQPQASTPIPSPPTGLAADMYGCGAVVLGNACCAACR